MWVITSIRNKIHKTKSERGKVVQNRDNRLKDDATSEELQTVGC